MDKGRKTSIYLNAPLARLAEARGEPLPVALHRGLSVTPLLIEEGDGYATHYYCAVPSKDMGIGFRVPPGRDYWRTDTDRPVREVYEIEVVQP